MGQVLLRDEFPELAQEISSLLQKKGEHDLARQIVDIRVVDRCRCGDDFCATFYSRPKPKGAYQGELRCVDLEPGRGMIVLDVVDEQVAGVEVLYRDEIRRKLLESLP